MSRTPLYDMIEIHGGKHPSWKKIENRVAFEEDMRIHLYEALENVSSVQMTDDERNEWEKVLSSLDNLAMFFKTKGFSIHIH